MKSENTEQKILDAAVKVFTEKGYEATRTRDIATEAGINIASLHYYFRSKEKLFDLIIQHSMTKFSTMIDGMLNNERPLDVKIREFVPAYIDFLKENSFLPMFILYESQKNLHKIDHMMNDQDVMHTLDQQLKDLISRKIIRPITVGNFMVNLIGLVAFPFLAKPLVKIKTGMDDATYLAMLEERKTLIPDMIIGHLYYEMPD